MKSLSKSLHDWSKVLSLSSCFIAAPSFCLLIQLQTNALAITSPFSSTVGVSYSRFFASNPLPVEQAMQQIRQNFSLVRFYDFDQELMTGAAAQGLQIVLTVPNEKLTQLDSLANAQSYVSTSVVPWKNDIKAIMLWLFGRPPNKEQNRSS